MGATVEVVRVVASVVAWEAVPTAVADLEVGAEMGEAGKVEMAVKTATVCLEEMVQREGVAKEVAVEIGGGSTVEMAVHVVEVGVAEVGTVGAAAVKMEA